VILHHYMSGGWEGWDVRAMPLIPDGMPILVDDDLRFEDGNVRRPAVVMSRWLRELPVSGASSPRTWRVYAGVLKGWAEFLAGRGVDVFADRHELRDAVSVYAEHRLSGPLDVRLRPASWNLVVKTLSAFYQWAAAEGHVAAVPFTYARRSVIRPDGARVQVVKNLATVRAGNAHATRKYLERPYVELLMNALAGNDASGARDGFRGRETGRNAAVIGLALASGLRAREFTYLTVYEVPPLPARPRRLHPLSLPTPRRCGRSLCSSRPVSPDPARSRWRKLAPLYYRSLVTGMADVRWSHLRDDHHCLPIRRHCDPSYPVIVERGDAPGTRANQQRISSPGAGVAR